MDRCERMGAPPEDRTIAGTKFFSNLLCERERGQRFGENDNWIAGFARYYREPLIGRDQAFDRAPGVRRISY